MARGLLMLMLLVGCGAPASSPRPSTRVDREMLARADLVVRGQVFRGEGGIGRYLGIDAELLLKGAWHYYIVLIEPHRTTFGQRGIFVLERVGEHHRVLEVLEVSLEPSVIAQVEPTPREVWTTQTETLRAPIAAFRQGAITTTAAAQRAAAEAATVVFGRLPMIGVEAREIERVIGAPDEQLPDGRWRYTRWLGGHAMAYTLRIEHGRVTAVEIERLTR